jgi:hypothetical protein
MQIKNSDHRDVLMIAMAVFLPGFRVAASK